VTSRLWLWCAPLPEETAAAFDAGSVPRLADEGAVEALLARAATGSEHLLVLGPERLAAVVVAALDLPPEGAAALQIDEGRGASLVLGPLGWELERFGAAGTGPHLAARR
jgi:hypothetical protein